MTRKLLHRNHYPERVIEMIGSERPRPRRATSYMQDNAALLKVPFRSEEIQRKVRQAITRAGFPVNLVFEHTPNLKDSLVRSAHQPRTCSKTQEREKRRQERRRGRPLSACVTCLAGLPERLCDSAGVVYAMQCAHCSELYVGETRNTVRERFSQHHYDARHHLANEPWGIHMAEKHSQIPISSTDVIFKDARILAKETRAARRKLREAIEIRERRPAINIYSGWKLTPCIRRE